VSDGRSSLRRPTLANVGQVPLPWNNVSSLDVYIEMTYVAGHVREATNPLIGVEIGITKP
jgi:hypothetical protein